jgi:quercetin dioxygenase-like cupin family protein
MFTGDVEFSPLAELPANTVLVSSVSFSPGANTHWHSHEGGQVLHVVAGRGLFQERGGPIQVMEVGETVVAAGGVEHWHGAAEGDPMTHVAISSGLTTWLEAAERAPGT